MKPENMSEEQLKEQFRKEFEALCKSNHGFFLKMSTSETWCVLGQLQLALRHPANNGPSAKTAKRIAEQLQRAIAPGGVMKFIADRGWDTKFDVFLGA